MSPNNDNNTLRHTPIAGVKNRMNISDIKDVHTICRHGSLRKAAAQLGITQPTLSNRIARLEEQMGVKLFDRSRGRSEPTRIALFIAERAEELIASAESLIQESLEISGGTRGSVRIGFGPAPAYVLLPRIVRALREQDSLITLECHTGTTELLTQRLAAGDLDLVFGPFDEGQTSARLDVEVLLEDDVVIITHPSHPLAKNPPTDTEEYFKYPIALTNLEPRYRQIVHMQYGHAIGEWDRSVLCSNYWLLIEIIQDGNYVSAGPRFTMLKDLEAGRLSILEIPDGPLPHVEHIIRNRDTFPYPALQTVVDVARAEAKKIVAQRDRR